MSNHPDTGAQARVSARAIARQTHFARGRFRLPSCAGDQMRTARVVPRQEAISEPTLRDCNDDSHRMMRAKIPFGTLTREQRGVAMGRLKYSKPSFCVGLRACPAGDAAHESLRKF